MKDTKIEVITLDPSDIHRAAELQARAFMDSPSTRFMFSGSPPDEEAWAWFLGTDTRYCLLYGTVYTTPAIEGVAAWLPPESTAFSLTGMYRSGMLSTPRKVGWKATWRLYQMIRFTERIQKQYAPERFYYLSTLSVDPKYQGKGIGSALIAPVLAKADTEKLHCYLETETGDAIRFYKRHGFRVIHEGNLLGNGPVFYAMLRDPK